MIQPVLLPYQQRWVADDSPIKLYTKSRRIGISWATAAGCVRAAAARSGSDVTYICYDKDITKQFVSDCQDWAKVYHQAVKSLAEHVEVFRDGDEDKSCLVYSVHFESGHTIEAIAGTPRKLRGRKGIVVIDEAAFLDNFPDVLEAARALLIWGGQIWIITTYNGVDNAFYDLEQDVLAGKLPYSRHFTDFKGAIAQGLARRVFAVTGKTWSPEAEQAWEQDIRAQYNDPGQELDCIPSQGGGVYLSRAIVEQCMDADVPVIRWERDGAFATLSELERTRHCADWIEEAIAPHLHRLKPNLRSYFGEDFARSGDLTIIRLVQEEQNLRRSCPFVIELRNIPFDQQRQILFWVLGKLPRFTAGAMDAGGNGSYLAEVTAQKFGFNRIHQIKLSLPWYSEHFPPYRAALQDRMEQLPKDADWLDDHRAVQLIGGVPKVPQAKTKGSDGKQRHGDAALAGVLCCYAVRQGGSNSFGEFEELEEPVGAGAFAGYGLGDYRQRDF